MGSHARFLQALTAFHANEGPAAACQQDADNKFQVKHDRDVLIHHIQQHNDSSFLCSL
jgi:hypothetical protein